MPTGQVKVSDLTEISDPDIADFLAILDTSDLTQSPFGSLRKIQLSNLIYTPASLVFALADSGYRADVYLPVGTRCESIINVALLALGNAGGGSVFFHAGEYLVNSPGIRIPSNIKIYGVGWATKFKRIGGGWNGLFHNYSAVHTGQTEFETGIQISDISIDGNMSNASGGDPRDTIWIKGATHVTIKDCYIYNSPDSAIVLDDQETHDCIVTNNIIDTTGDIGIYVSGSGGHLIQNNIVLNTHSYGIRMVNPNNDHNIISGNRVYNCGHTNNVSGINLQTGGAENNQVIGNYCIQNGLAGIRCVTTAYTLITGNYCYLNDRHGIWLGGAGRGVVSGNLCKRNSELQSNTYSGIYLDSSNEWSITGNRSGGIGSGTRQKYGIEEAGTSDSNLVIGNMLDRNGASNTSGALKLGANSIFRNNMGYFTEKSGTASILNGTTSITVTHLLSVTPTLKDIRITLGLNPTNDPGTIWVSNIGATTFDINCRNDPGASGLDLAWSAIVL